VTYPIRLYPLEGGVTPNSRLDPLTT